MSSKVFSVRIKEDELIKFIEKKMKEEFKNESTVLKEFIVGAYLNANKQR